MKAKTIFLKNLSVIAVLFAVIIPVCSILQTYLLPPTAIFYEAAQLPHAYAIGLLSSATRFGVAFSLFCIAFVKLVAISDHHSVALKRRARSISLMFMITGAWTSTIAMQIEFGGVWYIVSLVFGFIELFMSMYTVYMVMRTHREAIASPDDHD